MKFTDTLESSTERVIVVGLPGTGKTTLVAKLSESFNLLWLETENDTAVLRKLPTEWQAKIDFINIPDSAAVPMAADTLLQLFKAGKGSICHSHSKYGCALCRKESKSFDEVDFSLLGPNDIVVLNTASQLSASILAHTMKGKPVDTKPERDDWGALRRFSEYFGSQFQSATYNLIVICHAIEAELEDKKKKLVPNFGSAGMSTNFAKYFDHVIYCDVINKKFKAFSSSSYSGGILTKSRTDFEIEKLPEPSLIPLFTKGERNGSNHSLHNRGDSGNVISDSNNKQGQVTAIEPATEKLSEVSAGQSSVNNLRARLMKGK